MAKITETTPATVVPPHTFTLELDEDEFAVLYHMTNLSFFRGDDVRAARWNAATWDLYRAIEDVRGDITEPSDVSNCEVEGTDVFFTVK
jgi:hypothetical protein